MATFKTLRAQDIQLTSDGQVIEQIPMYIERVISSTGYWKYQRKNGQYSDPISQQSVNIWIQNRSDDEFTILPCNSTGTVTGTITRLDLNGIKVSEFNGEGLTGLTTLRLINNPLTVLNISGLSNLMYLDLMRDYHLLHL